MVSKEEIIKRIKKDMLTKGYLNKYSSCLSKPTPENLTSMISTPCIKVCKLIGNRCVGCGRTFNQISNWLNYTESKRKRIMEKLHGQ